MPDWAAIYDPRYCGPSREAYIEEMTRQYQLRHAGMMRSDSVSEQHLAEESVSTPKSAPSAPFFPGEESSSSDEESFFPDDESFFSDEETFFPDEESSSPNEEPSSPVAESSSPDEETFFPDAEPSSSDENPFPPDEESSFPDEKSSFPDAEPSTPEAENPSPDNAGVESENRPLFHISRKALVFYIIGAILLLVYFCFLIYRLISLAIHLFEI